MSDADAGVYYTPQAALDAVTDKPDLNAIMANPPFSAIGNAAALREALRNLVDAIRDYHENAAQYVGQNVLSVLAPQINAALDALSAPCRNCDLYATLAEAVLASGEAKAEAPGLTGMGAPQLVRFCRWLFAPAGKEAAK